MPPMYQNYYTISFWMHYGQFLEVQYISIIFTIIMFHIVIITITS